MTKLTEHFALEEMTVSPTAKRLGIPNTPTAEHIENMRYCCEKILEPVRAKFGPVTINSSYRAPLVNKAVGGSKTSQHVNGQAIDFEVKGVDNKKVADWVADNLEFDQVILEFYAAGDKNSGWVHASIKKEGGNRKQRLVATKSKAGGTKYTPVADFDPSTTREAGAPVVQAAKVVKAAPKAAPKVASTAGLGPMEALQTKCGITADGKWGPGTYVSAKGYYKLSSAQAAHFFGQCAHESGNFKVFSENLNYSDKGLNGIFKKYFPTIASTAGYARKPEKIANKVYANRMGNGPESSGDGYKFRGRGPIQLTGKDNYTAFSQSVGRPDVLTNPDIVATELAFESALWFFNKNGLFAIADKGVTDAVIGQITRRVNGGTHGLDDRIKKTKQFAAWG
jgi:putative chitinase